MITTTDLVAEVKRLAHSHPNATAQGRYAVLADDDSPNVYEPECIIGCALVNLGAPVEALYDNHFIGISTWLTGDCWYGDPPIEIELSSPEDEAWLDKVQHYQDQGMTWAQAVRQS